MQLHRMIEDNFTATNGLHRRQVRICQWFSTTNPNKLFFVLPYGLNFFYCCIIKKARGPLNLWKNPRDAVEPYDIF